MHFSSLKKVLTSTILFFASMIAVAQDIPNDEGPWGNPFGTWAGDTLIYIPTIPIRGGGNTAPALAEPTIAVYYHEAIFIFAPAEIDFSYSLLNNDRSICYTERITSWHSNPIIVSLTSFPSGHYTLLLYINKECLEGEFEKE